MGASEGRKASEGGFASRSQLVLADSGSQEQLIYAITGGKRNCLTRKLYDGPRTLVAVCHLHIDMD